MTIPKTVTQISVGSSDQVWALDANSNIVYYRNPITRVFEAIIPNDDIELNSIDVSYQGHVLALGTLGELYVWDSNARKFVPHKETLNETFDTISAGSNAIWATKQVNGETKVFSWDSDSAAFVEIPVEGFDVKSLTVGKRDDATIVLSTDGALYKYDYSTQTFEEYVSDVGIDDLTALTASSEDNIWALDADGVVYQFNALGGPEDVGGSPSFVEKSTALGLETTDIAQFATDDKEILYSVHDDALSFHDTSDIRIQNLLSEEHYDVAIKTYLPNGKDQPGTIHYAYSTDDGLFHSFNYNGQWIRSVPISGAGQATEIDIDFDKDGNVYVAWIEGLGNAAKAFVAVGEANTGYAGYVFHDPVPISEDNVEDKSIDLEVTDGGIVTITTTKIDDNFRHDDHDVYSYSLQRNDLISAPNQPEIIDLEGKIVEHSDLDYFVGLGLDDTPLQLFTLGALLSGMGFEWTSPGGAFTVRAFVRERFDYDPQDDAWYSRTGIEVNMGFDFATINRGGTPVNEGPLKSLKLSMLLQPSAVLPFEKDENGNFNWDVSTFLGAALEAYVDFTGDTKKSVSQLINMFNGILKTESDYQIGLFMELDGLWKAIQAGAALPAPPTTRFPTPPFEIIDTSTGEETDANSAPENVVAQTQFLDMINWVVNMALTPLGVRIGEENERQTESGEAETPPQNNASSDLEANPIIRDEGALVIYLGPYFKLSRNKSEADLEDFKFTLIKSFELEGRAAGFVRFESNEANPTFHLDQAGLNTVLDIKLNKWFWRPLDLNFIFYQYEEGVEYSASAPGSYEYTPGGNMDVYDPGALAFGGSEDGTLSDTIDRQGFTYVLGKQVGDIISAHGLFIEDATGPVEGMYDLVYSIDGEVNVATGEFNWFEDTKAQIGDSAGFNTNPTLALRDDGTLIAAWGNTSTDSAAYQAINDTPPGRAYFISGSDLKRGGSLDLSKLGPEPRFLEKSFYFSNDENLYSIGTSVAQLGDINTVNGNGNPDFAFGAPDALNERGRAYIIYGEDYTRVSDIDTLDGRYGFLIIGLEGDEIGTSIHSAGLYNDDDIPDFAISAPGAFDNAGAVYIIYGGHDDLWEAGGGQFTADQVGGEYLPGEVIVGGGDDDRFGTAIAGGYDITGDGTADLAIGSIYEGTITLVSRTRETPVVIDANVGGSTQFQGPDGAYTDLGSAIAMLPDANEDGLGDLLIGSSSGTAYVLFGNDRLESYSDNYVVSWQMTANRSMIVSFNGTDKNGDGILSAGIEGELDVLTTEFYENGQLIQTYTINQQTNKNEVVGFNYEIASGRVLVNSPVYLDDPENEVYGIRLGSSYLGTKPNVNLASTTQNQIVWYSDGFQLASVPVNSNYFSTISVPVSFDLDSLSSYKGAGITFSAATALPLAVADAGDVNGDGISDFVLGYDQSVGDDDDARPGRSYVVYGGEHLTEWEGEFDLEKLTSAPELGFVIEDVAGGRVAAAGDIDGDGYGDLIVSAPFADNSSTGTERVGTSFVIFGSEPGEYDPADNITISNDTANELAGSSIASLGDVDLDGRTDLMLGAPQEIRLEDTYLIYESTKLKYATKSVGDDAWNLTPRATPKCTSENGSVMSVLPCGRARRWRESCKRRFAYASRLPSPDPR